MNSEITSRLQKIKDHILISSPDAVSVEVNELSESMIKEISSVCELAPETYIFNIFLKDKETENTIRLHIIIAIDSIEQHISFNYNENIWQFNKLTNSSAEELYSYVNLEKNIAFPLRGHSRVPIISTSQTLNNLLLELKNINGINSLYAYEIFDKKEIEKIGNNPIVINCILKNLNFNNQEQIINYCYDNINNIIQLKLPEEIYNDQEKHASVINYVQESIVNGINT